MDKNKLTITVDKRRADKATQLLLRKSDLEHSSAAKALEDKLADDGENAALWLELAKELSKQMLYIESIQAVSTALSLDPFNWELIRYRAGKYLGLNRAEEAASELELASRLKSGSWDILYHLGLSYYLCGRFEKAADVYRQCLAVTDRGDMNLVAIVNWLYLTLKRMDRREEAAQVLLLVDENTEAGENQVYKDMVMSYKGIITEAEAMTFDNEEFKSVEFVTRGYGIAINRYFNRDKDGCKQLLHQICQNDEYWNAFGYIAACREIEANRLKL